MDKKLNSSAQKVQDALNAHHLPCQVIEMPSSTRTAQDAANAIGCQVGQIVKSLVFKGANSQQPVLLLVSGTNRVDEKKVQAILGEQIIKADADFVRQHIGFAIGGVPPLGHTSPIKTLIDEDLLTYSEIWAAAGTPNAVFRLQSSDLKIICTGDVISVK